MPVPGKSQVTGDDLTSSGVRTGRRLAGSAEHAAFDPNFRNIQEEAGKQGFEDVFMMYLPRICEHCVNPSCVASCPPARCTSAREDGIVLVDQDACRSWRFCVSGCPMARRSTSTGTRAKAEKCNFCYPRIEAGMPTVCSETCVGGCATWASS